MRYFVEFGYNGTQYFGYQRQKKQISVQETLEKALHLLLGQNISIVGAGRTDTGVHAKKMYAHFDSDIEIRKNNKEIIINHLNRFLPQDICIYDFLLVKENAHARFDALKRTYKYQIITRKNPFKTDFYASYHYDLQIEAMNSACQFLIKAKDFSSFAKLHSNNHTNLCTVYEAYWERKEDVLIFTYSANRFLRNMVRATVGTLLDVGRGKLNIEQFKEIIEKKDRKYASASAIAKGLILENIKYPKNIFLSIIFSLLFTFLLF